MCNVLNFHKMVSMRQRLTESACKVTIVESKKLTKIRMSKLSLDFGAGYGS